MPRLDGFTLTQRVRQFSSVPILILTARGQDEEKVQGLRLGADDYLTKPFNAEELVARIRAVFRRTLFPSNAHALSATATIGDLTIDYVQHLVTMHGREVSLTPIEYRILAYLAQNGARVVTNELLLEEIWGDYAGDKHRLQIAISRLRQKIEEDPTHPRYILTRPSIGYLLTDQSSKARMPQT
jgi:DNA-binding response OmpR family regulator